VLKIHASNNLSCGVPWLSYTTPDIAYQQLTYTLPSPSSYYKERVKHYSSPQIFHAMRGAGSAEGADRLGVTTSSSTVTDSGCLEQ